MSGHHKSNGTKACTFRLKDHVRIHLDYASSVGFDDKTSIVNKALHEYLTKNFPVEGGDPLKALSVSPNHTSPVQTQLAI